MLRRLRNRVGSSIKVKLGAVVIAAVACSVLLGALTAAWRDAERRFQSKQQELEGIAAALSATAAPHVAARDLNATGRTLSAIGRIPGIAFVQVLDETGRRMFQLGNGVILERPGQRVRANSELGPFSSVMLENYMIETPVISGGRTVGMLRIVSDVTGLRNALFESIAGAIATGLLAALIGIFATHRLQRSLTRPIGDLTRAMQEIQSTQDFTRTVDKSTLDETGLMVDAFNDMLRQIRSRDERLARHRERLEAEVEERTSELKAAMVAAESANAAKSDFLATMSHEIRTPLNGMLVMAELMSTADLPDRLQRNADVIVSSGQSLLAIINDILDLSKIEAGKLELERLPVDPGAITDHVVKLFSARAASKGLDLAYAVDHRTPRKISADPVRLNQILSNLVNNALKFTETGSVVVRIAPAPGEAPQLGQPCRVKFSVTDTGIGIPADKLRAIFDPFSQADQSTTRKFGGTGIGLSISRRLVAAMGGELDVESVEGEGSTFSFTIGTEALELRPALPQVLSRTALIALPRTATASLLRETLAGAGWRLAASQAGATPDGSSPFKLVITDPEGLGSHGLRSLLGTKGASRPLVAVLSDVGDTRTGGLLDAGTADILLHRPVSESDVAKLLAAASSADPRTALGRSEAGTRQGQRMSFGGVRVLAADDNAVNREVLAEALGRLDVKVVLVEDGQSAVDCLAEGGFDLVFMDCSMPVLDGYGATRLIRERERAGGRPAIPVVALTAHVAGKEADAWRDAGMSDYLPKPFTLKALAQCLERWLGPAKSAAAPEPGEARSSPGTGTVEAPVINAEVLDDVRAMQGPNGDLLDRIIGLYRHHAPLAMQRIEAALRTGTAADIASSVHALKSLCRNIGAERLGNLLHETEAAARRGEKPDPSALVPRLEDELQAVLAGLGTYARGPDETATAAA